MKFFHELLFGPLEANVHKQLVDDAAKAPQVRALVITFFHEGNFRSSIPPGPHVERNDPLHFLAPRPICNEHLSEVILDLLLRLPFLFMHLHVFPKFYRIYVYRVILLIVMLVVAVVIETPGQAKVANLDIAVLA